MTSDELRESYLAFFESKGHVRRASDVLVPTWDPSVLFTPAGMNQFKDHFLGKVKLTFTRATTSQKCLRTGDIENVGRTAYHHTFFEMLGNFSFGDYFKREAIHWAWEYLTSKCWLGLDSQRLSVSVYKDDSEAERIWHDEVRIPAGRIERFGEEENFWPAGAPSHGPDGVCGPCSEIFFHPDAGGAVEIWNLVFTQFNRVGNPPDNLRPLPSKNIDTGMGLERTASMLQGVDSNFHIDILLPIVRAAAEVCSLRYQPDSESGRRLRRITDHVRACTFAIHENVYPGPNKEKYVVRRLLRRAVLDGHQLGRREPFLHQLVPLVVDMMSRPYPELGETAARVESVIKQEEQNFFTTIDAGLARIEKIFADLRQSGGVMVDGQQAAELYQTYGLPAEVVESMAAERNLTFDWSGFSAAMSAHTSLSGGERVEVFKTGPIEALKRAVHATEFLGYETIRAKVQIKGIIAQNQLCDQLTEVGHEKDVLVVLDRSPFYGESGGQVGDTGHLVGPSFRFRVTDTQKDGELVLHHGHLTSGILTAGDRATAHVDEPRRAGIRRAHSATHMLHHALQNILGRHAQQQGSKVDDDWLRFDFTNLSPVTREQLFLIQQHVRERIAEDAPVRWEVVPLAEARQAGAMMLFGEKYPDPVRMVSMGTFSRELCGGTHLDHTGQVGEFEILGEEAVAAGTRRLTALTGEKAREFMEQTEAALAAAADRLHASPRDVPVAAKALASYVRDLKKCLESGARMPAGAPRPKQSIPRDARHEFAQIKAALQEAGRSLNVALLDVPRRIDALLADVQRLEQQLHARAQAGTLSADGLLAGAQQIHGCKLVVAETPGATPAVMRQLIDELRKKAAPIAVLLASRHGDDKVTIVAGVSQDLVQRGVHAGQWAASAAEVVGGAGGGRPDLAQAGGKHPDQLPQAFEVAHKWFASMITR